MSCEPSLPKTVAPTVQTDWWGVTNDVLDSRSGTYLGLKSGKVALKWIHTGRRFLNLTEEQSRMFERGSDMLGSAANATILTKYPFTLSDFHKKSRKYLQHSSRKNVDTRHLAEARNNWVVASANLIGDAAKIGMLMKRSSGLETISHCSDLVSDVGTITIHRGKVARLTEDLKRIKKKLATDDSKIRLTEERRHSMIKIASCVAQVIAAVLGLGVLLFNLPISFITLLSVSTISLALSLWAYYYRESMTHVLQEKRIKTLSS